MLVLVVAEQQEPEAVPVVVAEGMMVGQQHQHLVFSYIQSHAQSLLPWWGSWPFDRCHIDRG